MTENIKKKALQASAWVIGGYGMSQFLRLGGNLVLTRLLVPEAFGVMALANVCILGLGLFSDFGLGIGVIRSKRSNDPAFLNTAWTLQIFRGGFLWLMALIIAFPVANFYGEPILAKMILVLSLNFLFDSFTSTALYTQNKKIRLGRITAMELSAKFLGLVCMILWAYFYRDVWALVWGTVLTKIVSVIWSHFLEKKHRNWFFLERDAIRELLSFGKWVFFSTAMMFLATQADRVLLGKLFPLVLFGVYNIAVIFAELPKQILTRLSASVIFPVMTQFADLPRDQFRKKILDKRMVLLFPLALMVAVFAGFGDLIIDMLYDERYRQAGWMLPLLSLGMWPFVLCTSIDRCFFAIGLPKYPASGNFCKFIYMITCVPLLFSVAGIFGGVLAVAMNDLPVYFVINYGLRKEKLTCFKQDMLVTFFLVILLAIILGFRCIVGIGFPGLSMWAG